MCLALQRKMVRVVESRRILEKTGLKVENATPPRHGGVLRFQEILFSECGFGIERVFAFARILFCHSISLCCPSFVAHRPETHTSNGLCATKPGFSNRFNVSKTYYFQFRIRPFPIGIPFIRSAAISPDWPTPLSLPENPLSAGPRPPKRLRPAQKSTTQCRRGRRSFAAIGS